eukprot:TRINITY_DN15116_c0_g3_i1.p1 TRINITY_DN15116_c0_g3~~TRINITY_DN15116_c0_g3_i1.p1  ORF type:complete len:226 (+),score=8.70 TRINITY_DN15116_c0_g3_i1:89-679(+)
MPSLKLQPVRRRDFDGLSDDDTPWVVFRQHDDNGNIAVPRDDQSYGSGSAPPPSQIRFRGSWSATAPASSLSVRADEAIHGSRPSQDATSRAPASRLPSTTSATALTNQSINGEMLQAVTTGANFQHATTIEEKKKLMHDQGRCRPCSFHRRKSDGCRRGLECAFCHLCDETMHNYVKRKLRKGQASERVPFRLDG